MDYSDLIQEIVQQGRDWQQAKRKLARLGEARNIWNSPEYKVGRREVLRLGRVGRQTFKDIVQRWLDERGMVAKVRSEAGFHLPGVNFTTPWPHEDLPLGMSIQATSIHNAKHAVQTKYHWLNKITVLNGNVVSQRARTDETFSWATAEAFAAFAKEVQVALSEAFAKERYG